MIQTDDVHSNCTAFAWVFGTRYHKNVMRPTCWQENVVCVLFRFGSVGASKIRTRPKIYPNTTAPSSRCVASGVTSDTANPRGVKSQRDTIRDESWGKVYSHEYPHRHFNDTGLSIKCPALIAAAVSLNCVTSNCRIQIKILITSGSTQIIRFQTFLHASNSARHRVYSRQVEAWRSDCRHTGLSSARDEERLHHLPEAWCHGVRAPSGISVHSH